jgi:hypothetical protein
MRVLTSVGLSLNLIGIILLFIFGFPQPNLSQGIALGLPDANEAEPGMTVGEFNKLQKKKKTTYTIVSLLSLLLIIAGMVCQLVALWI